MLLTNMCKGILSDHQLHNLGQLNTTSWGWRQFWEPCVIKEDWDWFCILSCRSFHVRLFISIYMPCETIADTHKTIRPCEKNFTPKSVHFSQRFSYFQFGQNFLKSIPSSRTVCTLSLHVDASVVYLISVYVFKNAYIAILRSWSSLSYAVRTREQIPHVL